MRVLVLGSLGPNQDRICALARQIECLVYAYTEFHPALIRLQDAVVCVPLARRNLLPQLRYLLARYDITAVYSLLNAWDGSTEVTQELINDEAGIPIIRHYKEHPCVPTHEERRVLLETTAQIYINQTAYEYFRAAYGVREESSHLMDADMISAVYMTDDVRPKLRLTDEEPHLLIAGGLSASHDRLDVRDLCVAMSERRVHVHLYGYFVAGCGERHRVGDPRTRLEYERLVASSSRIHLHDYVQPNRFCAEWSAYDAGVMHPRVAPGSPEAAFEEMNMPYRYSAYFAATLPLVVPSVGQRAMREFVEREEVGILYSNWDELADRLYDEEALAQMGASVHLKRQQFSFEGSVDVLARILRRYSA